MLSGRTMYFDRSARRGKDERQIIITHADARSASGNQNSLSRLRFGEPLSPLSPSLSLSSSSDKAVGEKIYIYTRAHTTDDDDGDDGLSLSFSSLSHVNNESVGESYRATCLVILSASRASSSKFFFLLIFYRRFSTDIHYPFAEPDRPFVFPVLIATRRVCTVPYNSRLLLAARVSSYVPRQCSI